MSSGYPVIIIGSPRSGTTLVARLLQRLGVFQGADLLASVAESVFISRLDGWIVRESGGTIYRPAPVQELLEDARAREIARQFLRNRISSKEVEPFLGPELARRYRSLPEIDIPWGFKDPRATFTAPLWMEVLPQAKIVHVRRHGVDVANSQVAFFGTQDAEQMIRSYESTWRRGARIRRRIRKQLGLPREVRSEQRLCNASREGAFRMWETYVSQGLRYVRDLGERADDVKYEDLTSDPESVVHRLAGLCGLTTDGDGVTQAVEMVQSGRRYAFSNDPSSVAFADTVEDRLAALGYSATDGGGGT
jgi:hypothetical protein